MALAAHGRQPIAVVEPRAAVFFCSGLIPPESNDSHPRQMNHVAARTQAR